MTILTFMMLAAGLTLLVAGADVLVRGAADLAAAFGMPALVVGLTVVAFGTSAPETLVSVEAALGSRPEISLGNVVGSNIFNVLFILGISALITPLAVSRSLVRRDVPIMIGISIGLILLGLNGRLGRLEGALMLLGLVVYTTTLLRAARRDRALAQEAAEAAAGYAAPPAEVGRGRRIGKDLLLIGAGLAMLALGADWLVEGAVELAVTLGVSQLVIGLTIVAAGTSLPEVAASVAASVRGERDIAVGNIVGSNIFNILLVLGTAAMVAPRGLRIPPAALTFDLPVMTAVALACLPVFFTGMEISRWEGGLFLGYYFAYAAFIILDASGHEAAPILGTGLLYFVVPITAFTLAYMALRAVQQRRAARPPPPGP